MKRASVVILNWNGQQLLQQFLPSLIANTPAELAELVVADNGSTDNSVDFLKKNYPEIKLILLDKNYGFAEGYNRALTNINTEFVILANSDIEFCPNWLTVALDWLNAHPDTAVVQPKILSFNDKHKFEYAGAAGGFLDRFGYPFCRGRIFATVEKDEGQYDNPAEIVWASGACMIIRREDYFAAGGLDGRFFAHQEEIDLCWRLRARGRKIVCLPASTVYHVGGATLKMEHPFKTFLNFRNNLLMLHKNLPAKAYRIVMLFRLFTDWAAALQFLLKGHPRNALAVVKARIEFHVLKKSYDAVRTKNLAKAVSNDYPDGFYAGSVLIDYYFGRRGSIRKSFHDLLVRNDCIL
jgi:GT2 family glycosyltransferase